MADYFTQFASRLIVDNVTEQEWVDELCQCVDALVDEEPSTLSAHFNSDGKPTTDIGRLAVDLMRREEAFSSFCTWEPSGTTEIWFYSEDQGEPYLVALVVQAYYRHFKKSTTQCFSLEWASTCSKLREDGFGGGAVVANCETIRSMGTNDWIHDQLTKLGATIPT